METIQVPGRSFELFEPSIADRVLPTNFHRGMATTRNFFARLFSLTALRILFTASQPRPYLQRGSLAGLENRLTIPSLSPSPSQSSLQASISRSFVTILLWILLFSQSLAIRAGKKQSNLIGSVELDGSSQ
jgi:hypothetical protein